MYETIQQIASDVILDLRQVPGVDVQTYTEDHIKLRIRERFKQLFREAWWPDLTFWTQRTLDGTLGVITQPLTSVQSIRDIRCFDPKQPKYELPLLPVSVNPYELSGSGVQFYSQHEDRANHVIQFWPMTATGTITLRYRQYPTAFNNETILYIDASILRAFVVYDVASGDGANPNDIDRVRIEADALLQQRKRDFNEMPRLKDPDRGSYPTDWTEMP